MEVLRRLMSGTLQQQQQQQQLQHISFEDHDSSGPGQQQQQQQQQQQLQYERYKRSSWPATAVLQRPAPPLPFLHWCDSNLLAGLVSIVLVCWLCVATDYGVSRQLQYSTAHLASPASTTYASIAVRSSVLEVDLAGEVLLLEVQVQQRGTAVAAACSGPDAADYELAIGTATPAGARPAAVMPLCPLPETEPNSSSSGSSSSGDAAVYTVAVPIRQTNMLASPWEELAADVRLQLRCAGGPCIRRNTPGVSWTANWASDKMQIETERHMLLDQVTTLDAASAYPIDEHSINTLESLGLHRQVPEATFFVQMRRHPGIRVIQLLVALAQLGFILYCLMMGVGQVLCAYVLARFLCVRTHMTRRRTTLE